MSNPREKLDKIWDVVAEIADEGSITGKLDYRDKTRVTGRQTFNVEGVRFAVYVEVKDG